MALTSIPANLQETMWADAALMEAANKTPMTKFMGSVDNSIIGVRKDLSKGAGDTIRFGIAMNLDMAPVTADNIAIGNEGAMDIYDESVTIDQFRFGVRLSGEMDRQTSKLPMRRLAKTALARRLADHQEEMMVRMLCGDTTASFGSAGTAATNIIYGGVTATTVSAASTDSAWLDTYALERLREAAVCMDPPIQPYKVEGGNDKYVVIMHPRVFAKLRASATNLRTGLERAHVRGPRNPIWTGAMGEWEGMILHVSPYCYAPESGARRTILLGCQAGTYATGKRPFWVEDLKSQFADLGNRPSFWCGHMAGFIKTVVNAVDWGVYCIDTYAPTTGMAGVAAT